MGEAIGQARHHERVEGPDRGHPVGPEGAGRVTLRQQLADVGVGVASVNTDGHVERAHGFVEGEEAGIMEQMLVLDAAHRSEEHTSELQSLAYLVCRLLLEKKKRSRATLT